MVSASLWNAPEWTTRAARIASPRRRRDVVVREVEGEVVVADPRTGCTYHLNPTAWLVWQNCDGTTTIRGIAARMTQRYEVDEETALNDVEEMVGWLTAEGLCEGPPKP